MSMMKSYRKPPLAKSPTRHRPRRVLRSTYTSLETPPGCYLTKSEKGIATAGDMEDTDLRPEYRSISWELRALARMVEDELGNENRNETGGDGGVMSVKWCSPQFERGRFYEAYSARRNERLKRKKGENGEEDGRKPHNLGVAKKRDSKSCRKSVEQTSSGNQHPRYALRSLSKENKKPPLPVVNYDNSVFAAAAASQTKIGAKSRLRKI